MLTSYALATFLFLILSISVVHINTTASNEDTTDDAFTAPAIQVAKNDTTYPDHWLTVPLDHFNLFDNRTWQMRYLVNRKFYQTGGPIFIEIGGEWTIRNLSASMPQIAKLASKHSGIYFATEHRYYGKSLPFSDSFTSRNIKYLQVEQALEDLAFFIENIKSLYPDLKNSKVIVHGCSYGGMLATWVRSRFPHLVDISYASSAPVTLEIEYPGYYEVINEVYSNVTVSCIDTIKKGLNTTLNLLNTSDGQKIVNAALKEWTCGNLEEMDSFTVISKIIQVLNVQNDAHHYEEVSCLALTMDTDDISAFERLASMVVLKSQDKGGCSPDGSSNIEKKAITSINNKNPNHPFAINVTKDDYLTLCKNVVDGFTEEILLTGIDRMNRRYGGRNIKVTKLLSVQGSHDPWKRLGMLKAVNSEVQTVLLDGSHCVDVIERSDDPEKLIKGRESIRNIISRWIDEISQN